MNNRKIILNLYKTKIKICKNQGYELGSTINVEPNFNLGKALLKLKKLRKKKNRATFVASHVKQAYRDTNNVKDEFLINAFIDEGFVTLKNFDNFLKLKKKRVFDDEEVYIDYDFYMN